MARAWLSPVVPLAHAVVEPLAVVVEAAHAFVAGAAVLGTSTPAVGRGHSTVAGFSRLLLPGLAWGLPVPRLERVTHPRLSGERSASKGSTRALWRGALWGGAPGGSSASEETGWGWGRGREVYPAAGGGVGGVILSRSGTVHPGDGGVKRKRSFLSKQGPPLPGQGAEESKAAGPRACVALPDIAIF